MPEHTDLHANDHTDVLTSRAILVPGSTRGLFSKPERAIICVAAACVHNFLRHQKKTLYTCWRRQHGSIPLTGAGMVLSYAVDMPKPNFYTQAYYFTSKLSIEQQTISYPTSQSSAVYMWPVHIDSYASLVAMLEEFSLEIILFGFFPVTQTCTHTTSFSLDLTEPLCVASP